MNLRKTHLAAAVGAALLAGGTAVQAQNLQVQLYGQVNRALMFADDGHRSKTFFADGESSGTRFGFQGTSQITPGLRAGARIEVEYQSNSSDSVSFESPTDNPGLAERWFDVWVEGGWRGGGGGRVETNSGGNGNVRDHRRNNPPPPSNDPPVRDHRR